MGPFLAISEKVHYRIELNRYVLIIYNIVGIVTNTNTILSLLLRRH